jgi:hypothetical protein
VVSRLHRRQLRQKARSFSRREAPVAVPAEALVAVRAVGHAEVPVAVLVEAPVAVRGGVPGGPTAGAGVADGIAAAVAGISGRRGSGPTPTLAATRPATVAVARMATLVPIVGIFVPGKEPSQIRLAQE